MACSNIQLKGMSVGCRDGIGGIKKVYMIEREKVASVAVNDVTATTNPNMITGITMVSTGDTWYAYNFRRNTSDYTSTVTVDDTLGIFSVETILNLQFSNMSPYKATQLEALCKKDVVAIVEHANGNYWYFGETYALTPNTSSISSGKASTDGNLGTASLKTTDSFYPHAIVKSVIEGLPLDEPVAEE